MGRLIEREIEIEGVGAHCGLWMEVKRTFNKAMVGERARNEQINYLFVNEGVSEAGWVGLVFLWWVMGGGTANGSAKGREPSQTTQPIEKRTQQSNSTWAAVSQSLIEWWSGLDWLCEVAHQPQGGKSILFFNFCWPAARHQKVEWKEMVGLPSSLFRQRKDFSFGERSRAGKRNKQTQFHFLHSFKRMEWNEFGFFSINQLNAAQPIIKSILIWLRNEKDFIFWMEQSN